ncbi:MAG: DUF167 domain-containing protein [Kiritimatiellaeota bacterium]|nr:DUF167 domain-containing protein [Kiritimatiellota bacterium]
MNWITATKTGVMLSVHACPRAAQDQVQGLHGDAVKIRLRSPPVDGKANDALIAFLSRILDVPARDLIIVAGHSSRHKRIAITGVTVAAVQARLGL